MERERLFKRERLKRTGSVIRTGTVMERKGNGKGTEQERNRNGNLTGKGTERGTVQERIKYFIVLEKHKLHNTEYKFIFFFTEKIMRNFNVR